MLLFFFFFKQKTAYDMRISDWSSDVCSSDLEAVPAAERLGVVRGVGVIGGHVGAHDACGVARDVEPGAELVLGTHAGDAFAADAVPGAVIVADEAACLCHVFLEIGRASCRERVCQYV